MVGYSWKMKDGAIRYRVDHPDSSSHYLLTNMSGMILFVEVLRKKFPMDIPKALGKDVVDTVSYIDANSSPDLISGKSVTGAMHFLNQTPIDGYSKKQGTVETSTCGSEIIAARIGN